jgi:transposase-like protein
MGRKQSESTEVVWRDRLARFTKSNLTVRQFCHQEGVSNPSFYKWRTRLKKGTQGAKTVRKSSDKQADSMKPFVPVSVSGSSLAEVEFPNGVRIRVPATNAQALRVAITTGNDLCREVR